MTTKTTSRGWGGARPGAGRPPGPSRETRERQAFLLEIFGGDEAGLRAVPEHVRFERAASVCAARGDLRRAEDFGRRAAAARRAHRPAPKAPARDA